MQIAYLKCSSCFVVADHLLSPKGRKLKCATCGVVWRGVLEDDEKKLRRTKKGKLKGASTGKEKQCMLHPVVAIDNSTGACVSVVKEGAREGIVTLKKVEPCVDQDITIWGDVTIREMDLPLLAIPFIPVG